MKQGKSRFEFHLSKIETLFSQAASQENPALWLFLHDLRTPVFMLEGLSKLYASLYNKQLFTELKVKFKEVEDVLGAIDYYAAFAKEFTAAGNIPHPVIKLLESKAKKKIEMLHSLLKQENWFNGKRFNTIKDKLKEADWYHDEKETELFSDFYTKEIKKIEEFAGATNFVFDNVEEEVHELRRKLRWLSIYPHALQGAIQMKETMPASGVLSKYLTPEIVSSPFNQFPPARNPGSVLLLDKNCFLALSWMIAELGKIKDDGLRIKALRDALQENNLLNDTDALTETYQLLGTDYPTMEILLKKAGEICKQFFAENILHKL
ncbi:MAG: hypothetical protein ACM3H8_08885, partial [Sphingobacteriales bacterium]